MTDGIKEILDNPKILMLSYGNYISLDDYFKLKDYITTLQEENKRLKNREQECINHYLVQCKYASEMEGKYIIANNIINEIRELADKYEMGKYDYNVPSFEIKEILDKENKQ